MIRILRSVALAALLLSPLGATPAEAAGDSSVQSVSAHFTPVEAAAFSKTIERDLGAKGARVAIVFRSGRSRDKMPEGIAYTHGGFWVYRDVATSDGGHVGAYAVYNLYAGDGKLWPVTQSRLIQDWPMDFIQASAVDDVAVIIPSPEMQQRIIAIIDSPTYGRLHNPDYALVSNLFSPKYQNCTAFVLDVVAAAAWQSDDPAKILANLKAHFRPTTVKASGWLRLFGPMADARLRTDDQRGPVVTAEYASMAAFMRDNGLLQETYSLRFAR
jgi:hypothetical protein